MSLLNPTHTEPHDVVLAYCTSHNVTPQRVYAEARGWLEDAGIPPVFGHRAMLRQVTRFYDGGIDGFLRDASPVWS